MVDDHFATFSCVFANDRLILNANCLTMEQIIQSFYIIPSKSLFEKIHSHYRADVIFYAFNKCSPDLQDYLMNSLKTLNIPWLSMRPGLFYAYMYHNKRCNFTLTWSDSEMHFTSKQLPKLLYILENAIGKNVESCYFQLKE